METTLIQARVDTNLKNSAAKLFDNLGLDMTTAIKIFLKKCLQEGGIPFDVRMPRYNKETEEAIQEARDIMSGKVSAKSYSSAKELFAELDKE